MGLELHEGGELDFSPILIIKHSFSPKDKAKQIIKTIQPQIVKAIQSIPPFSP